MFSLSNIIIRTEIYPNKIEMLSEDSMAFFFRKTDLLFSKCMSVDGIVVSLLHHNCSRNQSCCGRPEARSEMRSVLIHYETSKKKARGFHISNNV